MSKYFEVEESQFVSLRVFVDVTLCDLCFFLPIRYNAPLPQLGKLAAGVGSQTGRS